MSEKEANYGWGSDFPEFKSTPPAKIRERLRTFIDDASPEQLRAWADSIPPLQKEVDEVLARDEQALRYTAILEYELPMESRRPDVVLLVGGGVLVVELKGKIVAEQADLDQVSAYVRDLRCYHRACADRPVVPVLVPTRARGYLGVLDGVHIVGPDALDELVREFTAVVPGPPIERDSFLVEDAYRPLPTLVQAARELMKHGELRSINRARAATDPAVEAISKIIHAAALAKNSRHLIAVTGVPGAGKTLVGLRTVHSHFLDDLAVEVDGEKPTVPAVFLSGNLPLVEVLQYELRSAGGDGKTFVRLVKEYVKRYTRKYARKQAPTPREHVLVFDEAQRAFDATKMAQSHKNEVTVSEPEQFIALADLVPEWCVVVALIGSGQEINTGEEAGVEQWRAAVEKSGKASQWTIHAPPGLRTALHSSSVPFESHPELNLDTELRFHAAGDLHQLVAAVLSEAIPDPGYAELLEKGGFHLRVTRSLGKAKAYLRQRYADNRQARYGLLASARDKSLEALGVPNSWAATNALKVGPWYSDDEFAAGGRSCRRLETCVTEFSAQGLELDASLLAWGTDLIFEDGKWSNSRARAYARDSVVHDPMKLRINAYRVLLTRGRDCTVVWIPDTTEMNATYARLRAFGFKSLDS